MPVRPGRLAASDRPRRVDHPLVGQGREKRRGERERHVHAATRIAQAPEAPGCKRGAAPAVRRAFTFGSDGHRDVAVAQGGDHGKEARRRTRFLAGFPGRLDDRPPVGHARWPRRLAGAHRERRPRPAPMKGSGQNFCRREASDHLPVAARTKTGVAPRSPAEIDEDRLDQVQDGDQRHQRGHVDPGRSQNRCTRAKMPAP